MKKILKVVGIGFAALLIILVIIGIAFPTKAEVEITSFKSNDEVTTENLEVVGKYKGSPDKILVNGEEAEKKSSGEFRKIVKLNPGENKIKAEAQDDGKIAFTTESVVYFDLEGKLFQEKNEAFNKERDKVPEYELVRKEDISGGFSAIIYADVMGGDAIVEHLVANLVNDIKSKNNSTSTISLLIFSNADKQDVEGLLEKSDNASLKTISQRVKAEYSKTDNTEELFIYPSGLEGDKLALAIK